MNAAFPIRNHIVHPDGWGVKLRPEEVLPTALISHQYHRCFGLDT
jgi:hypothetical protein